MLYYILTGIIFLKFKKKRQVIIIHVWLYTMGGGGRGHVSPITDVGGVKSMTADML